MSQGDEPAEIRWFHQIKVDGAVAYRAGKLGESIVADWPGLGSLTCARDGSNASFAPADGATPRALGKLKRAQVNGLLRDLAGQLAVHASAAAIDGQGVLFLGADGAGKSTAAAEMCLCHGAELLADDAASLDVATQGVRIVPSEDDHWLTPRSRAALGVPDPEGAAALLKQEVRTRRVANSPAPLALTLFLRFDASVSDVVVRRPRGSEAARWLLEAAIRFDVEDGAARGRELEQLMTLHRVAPFLEVVRPAASPGGVAGVVFDALRRKAP